VTAGFAGTERYDAAHHDVTGFFCGNELLDRWLVRYAGQNQRRDAARTFVAATDDRHLYGYYTFVAATPETPARAPEIRLFRRTERIGSL
jgi:hypothetical protein